MENISVIIMTIIKTKILSFKATWINLEDIMLSEISQAQKDKYHMFLLMCES
jgi:hypothetical protein